VENFLSGDVMDKELKIKQLHQAYNELESNIKRKNSFYVDDANCFKMRHEQSNIMRQIVQLESSED
jgi:hypothetical protein